MSTSNHNSTNPNISKNEDLIKIKKFKIINLPSNVKNPGVGSNSSNALNNIINNNLRKSFNSKKDMQNLDNRSKLTFEKAFSFRKSNVTSPVGSALPSTLISNASNTHLNTILTQSQSLPSSNPIVINNFPPQSQISISINNFNINNYNLNTKKFKKGNQISTSMNTTPNSLIEATKSIEQKHPSSLTNPMNINNINLPNALTPKRNSNKNSSFVLIKDESTPAAKNSQLEVQPKNENQHTNIFNSGGKLKVVKNEFNPGKEKLKSGSTKKSNKIETIIDGNNDSFINELADLLNGVDQNSKQNEPVFEEGKHNKEYFNDSPNENEYQNENFSSKEEKINDFNEVFSFIIIRRFLILV